MDEIGFLIAHFATLTESFDQVRCNHTFQGACNVHDDINYANVSAASFNGTGKSIYCCCRALLP